MNSNPTQTTAVANPEEEIRNLKIAIARRDARIALLERDIRQLTELVRRRTGKQR